MQGFFRGLERADGKQEVVLLILAGYRWDYIKLADVKLQRTLQMYHLDLETLQQEKVFLFLSILYSLLIVERVGEGLVFIQTEIALEREDVSVSDRMLKHFMMLLHSRQQIQVLLWR